MTDTSVFYINEFCYDKTLKILAGLTNPKMIQSKIGNNVMTASHKNLKFYLTGGYL